MLLLIARCLHSLSPHFNTPSSTLPIALMSLFNLRASIVACPHSRNHPLVLLVCVLGQCTNQLTSPQHEQAYQILVGWCRFVESCLAYPLLHIRVQTPKYSLKLGTEILHLNMLCPCQCVAIGTSQ